MLAIPVLAARGIRQIRRGEVLRHRRSMTTCALLVAAFLVSYPFKLALLGPEDLSVWSPAAINTLRFHETCVLAMVVGGAVAGTHAWRMRRSRNVTRERAEAPAPAKGGRCHRMAGWTAVVGAALAKSQGTAVLRQMQESMAAGEGTAAAIIEGVLVLVAGVTLLMVQ